ncbi:MAG: 2-hydroxyacyl-CoA dehydratase [Proteobacteria bacterium]|nr:2-hydroxyacyl-CoA dehydratase [Pseudomonadota bacterium]
MEKPKAKEVMKELTKTYYGGALRAREEGRFVAYTTAISPVELFYAHDIIPIYPENHAVMCLTGRMMPRLSLEIEKRGYTTHLCAYARSDLGYRELQESPIGGIPDPDFLLACNAQCFTLTKWFQVLSRRYGVPVFVVDTPQFIRKNEARKNIIKYVEHQLAELIEALEELTGRTFDYDRLGEVMGYSAEASRLYREFLDLASIKPSPISIFDALIHMAIIVYLRGTKEAVDYYKLLIEEIQEEKISKGIGAIPNERFRLYWENLPIWFKFRDHFEFLAARDAVILTSLYAHAWTYDLDVSSPMRTLAENYAAVFSNVELEERAERAVALFRRYSLNGNIMFMNRSCKAVTFGVLDLRDLITRKTGIPALVFESDMGDPRFYSEVQIRTRLEAYLETLDRMGVG